MRKSFAKGQARLHPDRAPSSAEALRRGESRIGMHFGQATVEYAITSGIMAAVVVILGLLLTTFSDYGQRLLEIIAFDYP